MQPLLPLLLSAFFTQPPTPPQEPLDWKKLEAPYLSGHLQLTQRDQFVKAGEAYFSPEDGWIIFQAVPVPPPGKDADPFYSMYVAKVTRNQEGRISGLDTPIRVSPDGSANTCGWFDPDRAGVVLFGSTLKTPSDQHKSGFQVGSRKYVWMFPDEMEVVQRSVIQMLGIPVEGGGYADSTSGAMGVLRQQIAQLQVKIDKATSPLGAGSPQAPALRTQLEMLNLDLKKLEELAPLEREATPVFTRNNYDAECSYSSDGRFILYSHIEDAKPDTKPDANIYIYDTKTRKHIPIVVAPGYDGGPFFSPDGKRICYRSDRKGNDLLQLYIADLAFDDSGVPTGISFEYQVTDNEHVNWAPYWHPSGTFLVYGTSEVSHANYEVFAVSLDEAAMAKVRSQAGLAHSAIVPLARTRITWALGADVLPVFSHDGKWMMWTSQRGEKIAGEEKPSSQLWIAKVEPPLPAPR